MKIQLGNKVKDKVSGLTGIATSRVEYLNGCIQFGIEPPFEKGGKLMTHYVDESQLMKMRGGLNTSTKKKVKADKTRATKKRGGPQGHGGTPTDLNRSIQRDINEYSEES